MQQCTAGERNSEIFQNQYKPWEEIVVMITRDTGKRFLSWRDAVDDAPKSREFLDSWQILVQFTVPSPTWCSWRPRTPLYPRQVHGSEYVCRAFSFVVEWPPTSKHRPTTNLPSLWGVHRIAREEPTLH